MNEDEIQALALQLYLAINPGTPLDQATASAKVIVDSIRFSLV